MIDMVFTTEGFFEVAIESWPEWNFNTRPLQKKKGKRNKQKQERKQKKKEWFKFDMKYDRYNAGIHYLFQNKGNVSG